MSRCPAMVELSRAIESLNEAKVAVEEQLPRAFPVGSEVVYRWGQHNHSAEVIEHSYDRLRVTCANGSTRWIGYWLAMGGEDQPIPEEVFCTVCNGFGFTMHAKEAPDAL